ncbi:t-SNARE [Jimgerdemannia flammicorona]|uniref:t-SNARE n=1 Tax=Jimgerdemannia flammicorona TaxID=994334 RepID=A0A433QTT7_9FUNG|nr:t-SNARE [Jimgerdemannia flammicorona]
MNSIKDRTQEFHSAVESIRSRSHQTALERRSLLATPPPGSKKHSALSSKSEFAQMAGQIGKEINIVAAKLEKLTKRRLSHTTLEREGRSSIWGQSDVLTFFLCVIVARRKTLFDDKPELTFIIKQDIAKLNKQIAQLQDYVRTTKGPSKQASEHSSNVVVLLQSKLATTSMSFKDVLEIRTQGSFLRWLDRREQFMFSTAEQSTRPTITNSPLLNTDRRAVNSNLMSPASPTDDDSTLGLGIPMLTPGQQQAQMMVMQQEQYIESRSTAIESIESTIAELGNIFQQLAQMVAEQREQKFKAVMAGEDAVRSEWSQLITLIDQNTDDIEMNVTGAQKELQKYFNNISSNRWLMMKIFATIVFFALVMAAMS